MNPKRRIIFIVVAIMMECCKALYGQLDHIHFLPPLHSRNEPGEQYLYLSTPSKVPITINISNGSNGIIRDCSGADISSVVISNSSPKVLCLGRDYGAPLLASIRELNRPLRRFGLVMRSTGRFYANLRIFSNNMAQAGSLTCKGKWARGRRFRIGHVFSNNDPKGHKCHFVGIMAEKDGTTITIRDIPLNLRFSGVKPRRQFILNRGESYVFSVYLDAKMPQNDNGLMGALLESDKPIYVNCGSWTGSPNGFQRDMGIDQITPVKVLGRRYIVVKGLGPASLETPIVIADQDNTRVFLNGANTPYKILQAGQWVVIPTTKYFRQQNMFIRSNNKIAVYQMLGVNDDPKTVGLNFIPPLSCVGDSIVDNIVDIHHIGPRQYESGLFVLKERSASLWINGKRYNTAPNQVLGNPDFVTYRIVAGLPKNVSIRSDGIIQVGIYGSSPPSGFAGYFAGFRSFSVEVKTSSGPCSDTIFSELNNVDYYEWYFNDSLLSSEQDTFLRIRKKGRYKLIGYQCNGQKDSSEEILLGTPDSVYLDSMVCGARQDEVLTERFTNMYGCDSVVFTVLHALPEDSVWIESDTCDKAASGVFTEVLSNKYGCDSIVHKQIKWIPSDRIEIEQVVCNPKDTGVYEIKTKNKNGCDSITRLILYLGRRDTTEFSRYVCDPDSVGVVEQVWMNSDGCDSLVRYDYKQAESFYFYEKVEKCRGEEVVVGGVQVTKDTAFSIYLHTRYGCDSVFNYTVVFHPGYEMVEWDTICEGEVRLFQGLELTESGRYFKEYTSTYGCDSTHILHLTVNPRPQPEFEPVKPYCHGDTIDVRLRASYEKYLWSDGSDTCCLRRDKGGNIEVLVWDTNGCTSSIDQTIPDPIEIEAHITVHDVLCYGQQNGSLELNQVSGGIAPYSYLINDLPFAPPVVDRLDEGEYRIQVRDSNGCLWADTVLIDAPSAPFEVRLMANTTRVRWGNSAEVTATIRGGNLAELVWRINDQKIDKKETSILLYPREKSDIWVMATDHNGCEAWAQITIDIFYDPKIYVPNVFTPNADAVNDWFEVFPNDHIAKINVLRIYSRWGELLYEVNNVPPKSPLLRWDGRFHGQLLNNSVVVYMIKAESINHKVISMAGDVTIAR